MFVSYLQKHQKFEVAVGKEDNQRALWVNLWMQKTL